MLPSSLPQIGLGGGCHWCTEAVFQSLKGVAEVRQGFIRSDAPDDVWSEAVEIDYDPESLELEDLIAVHLATHASNANHKMRGKYRSAIYVHDPEQNKAAAEALASLAEIAGTSFKTRIMPHRGFKPSDARFRNYYETDPERPFCQTYIDPKLAILRERFSRLLKEYRKSQCSN